MGIETNPTAPHPKNILGHYTTDNQHHYRPEKKLPAGRAFFIPVCNVLLRSLFGSCVPVRQGASQKNFFTSEITMRQLSFKTQSANEKIVKRDWYVVDATNQTMGRMASKIAHVLRGKNKPYYTPHFDCGDYVIVVNSGKVVFTGNKMADKEYLTYSGYPGGQKAEVAKDLIARRPNVAIEARRKRHAA